ncbi:hypothetical protein [Streptomyces sp. NPDC046860]|uniref:hypothetical protein n=1 Tax=Streptomyces sp. NPDC046860 TaxID=3154495 RepID=UPI0033F4BE4A
MNLPAPHRRLLTDVLASAIPSALAGGYALQAHGLLERPHANMDLATESAEPMSRLAAALRDVLVSRGHEVTVRDAAPLSAHLSVTDPESGTLCPLALHKEAFWSPPVLTPYGPTLSLEDAVGTKIRALYDRGAAVDLIDARAAAGRFSLPELEELGRRHAYDAFDLPTLQSRLTGTDFYSDLEFLRYELPRHEVGPLRAWAQHWSDDIAERLLEDGASPDEDEDDDEDKDEE